MMNIGAIITKMSHSYIKTTFQNHLIISKELEFVSEEKAQSAANSGLVTARFVDNYGKVTEQYPSNPNGSPFGITGLTSADGRVTIMMPHPERVARTVQNSYALDSWGEDGPWTRMFRNARVWVG